MSTLKKAAQNKMSIVGVIASGLSICMYVSYIPQIMGNLSGHQGDWIQPFVAFINCTMWVGYGFFREHREWPLVLASESKAAPTAKDIKSSSFVMSFFRASIT